MKRRPSLFAWICKWFELRNAGSSAWHLYHRQEAQEWLDQRCEELGGGPRE